jgi:hypothetical protein
MDFRSRKKKFTKDFEGMALDGKRNRLDFGISGRFSIREPEWFTRAKFSHFSRMV